MTVRNSERYYYVDVAIDGITVENDSLYPLLKMS